MKTPQNTEQKSLADALTRTNWLLTAIAVLLAMGLIMDVLIYSSVITLPNNIHYGFNAIYERMGRMRVY
ncbi:MAG: hypothetical protein K2L95_02810 [Alphaproteobacteria bacterium]|nr:hypothetical protein [Alphaproteobacteria bacterium]